jgi:hypothetical protein
MKKVAIITTVFLMAAGILYAGEGPGNEHHQQLAEYLQLSAAQQAAFENAHADFHTATAPLFERWAQLGHDTEAALKNKSADACAIGNMMIASQAISDQIKAQKTALEQKLEAMLTPDQKTKYEAFKAARPQMMERHKISSE